MYRRSGIIILICIFIGAIVAILGIWITNEYNWDKYSKKFAIEKELQINYYFEKLSQEVMNAVVSHAHWDEALEALNRKDDEWLSENATTYIIEDGLFSIDYIFIANENMTFIQESGVPFNENVITLGAVQKSIQENESVIEIIHNNGQNAIIVSTPFLDNKYNNPTGVYVAISFINEQNLNALRQILNEESVKEISLSQEIASQSDFTTRDYRYIDIAIPIFGSHIFLNVSFELIDIYKVFAVYRNNIIVIVTTTASIVAITIFVYIKRISKELKNIVERNYLDLTEVIANAVEINDKYTYRHNKAVSIYSRILAAEVNYKDLDSIAIAANFHDIGKISIPSHILNKTDKLTVDEYNLIKQHPIKGYQMIKNIEYFDNIKAGVKHHHERWDGSGYPDGLKGDDIPLCAQIIAIADTYDALTSDRAYRKAMSHEQAVRIINENSGIMFNPSLIEAFNNKHEEIAGINAYS